MSEKFKYVKMRLCGQLFGMRVDDIEDILSPQEITPIPLSPPDVMGSLNLRGRVVTAIDMKVHLDINSDKEQSDSYRSIVLEYAGSLYSLIVDDVSEVIDLEDGDITKCPGNLSEKWKEFSIGVHSLKEEIMVILDVDKLMQFAAINDNKEED